MQFKNIKFIAIIAVIAITSSTGDSIFPVVSIPRQALAEIKNTGDKEAKKLIQQGKKQLNSNNFEAALQSYQQALMIYQSIGDIFGEADAFIGLGNVYFALKNSQQAINYYQQSLTIAQKTNHLEQKSDSLSYLANAYSALENSQQAINYYRQSLEAFNEWKAILGYCKRKITTHKHIEHKDCRREKNKNERRDCEFKNNISELETETTETTDKECQSLSKEISSRKIASLNGLANAYSALGYFKQAIDSYNESLEIAQDINDRKGKGYSVAGLGDAYSALGDFNQAIAYYQQSLKIAQKMNDRKGEGHSVTGLGNVYYAIGEFKQEIASFKQAIAYYQQSLKIAQEINDRTGEEHSVTGLGNVYSELGDFKQAIAYHQQSLKIAQEINDQKGEEQSVTGLGNVYSELGDFKQAIAYHQQSLKIAQEINDQKGEGDSLNNLGRTLLKKGDPQAAEKPLRQSLIVWQSIWDKLGDNDQLKISFFEETLANTYRLLQEALIAQNKKEQALEIAGESRARAFVELIVQHHNSYSYPPLNSRRIIDIARERKATLVVYSIAWNDLYIWVVKQSGEISLHKVDLKKNLGNLALDNLAEDARTAAAGLAEGHSIATNVITNLVSSTRSALTKRSDNPSPAEGTNAPRTLSCRGNNCLQQMYKLLIQPIAAELPTNSDSRVIFIPHESLFLVPFAALQDPTNKKFMIEKYTISIAPSFQVLELTNQRRIRLQESVGQRPAVGVGIPQAALVVGNPKMPTIGHPPKPLDPLPGAEKEAQDIAELLKTQALTGKQATKAAVEQQMAGAKIIHLATHGLLDELSEPGIPGAVALAPSGKDNGLLSANEVLNLHLNANLVVLSACDTGRGRITGDGVIGLSRSFIAAGTPSVIVSLWQVPDGSSTASLMLEFYRQLEHNPDKASALRQAMLNTMKTYPDPRDWAAFFLIGESE